MKTYKITLTEDELDKCRLAVLNQRKMIEEASVRMEMAADAEVMAGLENLLNTLNIQKDDPRNASDI